MWSSQSTEQQLYEFLLIKKMIPPQIRNTMEMKIGFKWYQMGGQEGFLGSGNEGVHVQSCRMKEEE